MRFRGREHDNQVFESESCEARSGGNVRQSVRGSRRKTVHRGEKIATLDDGEARRQRAERAGEERRARLLIEIVEARNRLTNPESRLASD